MSVTPEALERVARFCSLLIEWNRRLNLTGAPDSETIVSEHLPDSLAAARLVPSGAEVLDVGSGGGLPAVPLAILRPDCSFTLAEPRAKRVAFLRAAIRECGCARASVVRARHDEVSRRFSLAMSRATFSPAEWLRISSALIAPASHVLVFSTVPVATDRGCLEASLSYEVGKHAPRWLGRFRFT